MCCLYRFNCFTTKKTETETELRIRTPLNLDELPDTIFELRAHEGAILDNLISIHYTLENLKMKDESSMKVHRLVTKKDLFEKRLEKVREKLDEIKSNN